MPEVDSERTARIRRLNDFLRCNNIGGQIVITAGLAALGPEAVRRVMESVAAFKEFGPDNDPHNEHDCAIVTVEGHSIIWKIDYYDLRLKYLSPDPSSESVTARVMTVMLAEEY
ncbi:MAG: DUF3768 domain-containing protein [Rhizomicrobium sp.]|nr:DUF3768 domain-containing protein [Rhizomicrobium sp.]